MLLLQRKPLLQAQLNIPMPQLAATTRMLAANTFCCQMHAAKPEAQRPDGRHEGQEG
eukprot:CAMPEP_0206411254 /NCGR_PEP_ID=MMETSP0294-20121207/33150_1 /ASSEMBLY_ACC=CAM_ASM_000327 /TAXON_ID=39354 /ORGANISM="Heterosigma akashiwo, Strain CCMP2393" /LENGTH=56 /DNA_ID=CAMNT_0053871899 /DNA_START=216 /DNA_END=383 /DNA_ORIENTATION=-